MDREVYDNTNTLTSDSFMALIPKRCGSCGTPLSKEEINWCGLCEFSWVRHSGHAHCRFGERLDWRLQWSWLRLATPLERQLVHALKYDGDASLGHALGARMAREFTMGATVGFWGRRKIRNMPNFRNLPNFRR